jgi:manganese/iron transport system permease protein
MYEFLALSPVILPLAGALIALVIYDRFKEYFETFIVGFSALLFVGELAYVLMLQSGSIDPLAYGFMQRGLTAAVLVGIVCAVMGTFVVLKGLAFIGDAVSHAAFPGLVIAFMLGLPLYLGGAVASVGTALAIGFVSRHGRLRFDTTVGVLFAGTFALGILLFSTIRNYVSDLLGYLLGNVLGIGVGDLVQVALLGAVVLAVVIVIRKELLFATFDPLGAAASGCRSGRSSTSCWRSSG